MVCLCGIHCYHVKFQLLTDWLGSGKNWHDTKKAFRPSAGLSSYSKRLEARKHQEAVKEREREMKEEKEAERQVGSSILVVVVIT